MTLGLPALLFSVAGGLAASAPAPEDLPRGKVIEKVVCRSTPDQSYALYLPAGYSSARRWPILYALDARGRALIPAGRFAPAAAAWGWVVASSYGTRSDSDSEPSVQAVRAMWDDTHERVAIDGRRVYMAGFSGMARLSVALASNARGGIAGVIGVGTGFPAEMPPTRNLPFLWFGAAGDRDFNYAEMRLVETLLENFGGTHRFRGFVGRHEWPPAEVCAEAVAWMEVQGARKGLRSRKDPALAALAAERLRAADVLAASGKTFEAYRSYRDIGCDFETLVDVSRAKARAKELIRSEAVLRAMRQEDGVLSIERAELRRAEQVLRDAVNAIPMPPLAGILRDLRIDDWKKAVASATGADALLAERLLGHIYVQTAFYLPERFNQEGHFGRSALVLSVAAEIRPEEPAIWLALARAQSKAGRNDEARRSVARALDRGADREAIESDTVLAPLLEMRGSR